jgi:hypothetical protein
MKTEGRSSTRTRKTMLSLAYHIANALELSFVVFHAWESDFVVSWSLGCNIKPYVILDVCLNTLNSGHVGFLIVLCSVMVSRLVYSSAVTKPRASCGVWHKVCCSTRVGIEAASHDPSWNYTNGLSSHDHFLGYLFLFLLEGLISNQDTSVMYGWNLDGLDVTYQTRLCSMYVSL